MSTDPALPAAAGTGQNARYGLWFFGFYCLLYAGFMGVTAFSFQTLETPVLGVNLAVLYGMGLIAGAIVLAVLYMVVCNTAGEHPDTDLSQEAR